MLHGVRRFMARVFWDRGTGFSLLGFSRFEIRSSWRIMTFATLLGVGAGVVYIASVMASLFPSTGWTNPVWLRWMMFLVQGIGISVFFVVLVRGDRTQRAAVREHGWGICPNCLYGLPCEVELGDCPECRFRYRRDAVESGWRRRCRNLEPRPRI